MEFNITGYDNKFRIKKMNAIELFSLRESFHPDNFDGIYNITNSVLERIEVQCGDKWLNVKEPGKEIYFPVNIENDVQAVKQLFHVFIFDYMNPVFQKSGE